LGERNGGNMEEEEKAGKKAGKKYKTGFNFE